MEETKEGEKEVRPRLTEASAAAKRADVRTSAAGAGCKIPTQSPPQKYEVPKGLGYLVFPWAKDKWVKIMKSIFRLPHHQR